MAQSGETIDESTETISLLQEEIARLESELESRDEALRAALEEGNLGASEAPSVDPGPEFRRLEAELVERDEVIVLLLDQGRLYEEAADAQRQEWEQLNSWVEEVERRMEGLVPDDGQLNRALDHERKQSDQLRQSWADERRTREAEKASSTRELQHLRERLTAARGGGGPDAQTETLERENQKLRQAVDHLGRSAALADEVEPLRQKLAAALAEVDRFSSALRKESDDRKREGIESEATIRAIQSKLARLAAEAAAPPPPSPATAEVGSDSYKEVDERIRAFRQHLRELHEREEAERSSRTLTSRLSRLWRHTGPS